MIKNVHDRKRSNNYYDNSNARISTIARSSTLKLLPLFVLISILQATAAALGQEDGTSSLQSSPSSPLIGSSSDQHVQKQHLRKRQETSSLNRELLQGNKRQEEINDLGGSRIFLQYRGPRARRIARRCANSVLRDSDDDDYMIIQASGLCMEQFLRDPDILEADFDYQVKSLGSSTDGTSNTSRQQGLARRSLEEITTWGLEMIQADQLEAGDNEVTICLVDTGVAIGHPDLDSSMITGTDTIRFYGPELRWSNDKNGHGTHVAGTLVAQRGNGIGIAGVGRFHLHVTRALDDEGNGYESDIQNAITQCIDAGAKIINLSLGGTNMSARMSRFYTRVVDEYGVMLVAAAGNSGNGVYMYPASHPKVISVSAVEEWGRRRTQSNRNDQVEFSAPGHQILSTSFATSAVRTPEKTFPAVHIVGTSEAEGTNGSISGAMVYCEADDSKCKAAKNGKICFMAKDSGSNVLNMLQSCANGGGSGAIIFDADDNGGYDQWNAQGISIPAVAVGKAQGLQLMNMLGATVTIGDADNDGIEYFYSEMSGTSMASPYVASAAALLLSNHAECSNHQIRYALAMSAENPDGGCDINYGYGIVKVKDAHDWLLDNPCNGWDVPALSRGGCTTL